MGSAAGARFALAVKQTKQNTWIEIGESFAGYTLERFDQADERLVLRRGDETVRLSLKPDAPVSAKSVPKLSLRMCGTAAAELRWAKDLAKGQAAKKSFNAGDLREAERLAREILGGERNPIDTGRPLHDAHMVLGRIALQEGRVDEAVASLLTAARDNRGDPSMSSFGPNVSLAKDLLDHGKSEAVLQYLELCRRFWKSGPKYLDAWTAAIRAGGTPDFGPNLRY